jgi:hypothetical protein
MFVAIDENMKNAVADIEQNIDQSDGFPMSELFGQRKPKGCQRGHGWKHHPHPHGQTQGAQENPWRQKPRVPPFFKEFLGKLMKHESQEERGTGETEGGKNLFGSICEQLNLNKEDQDKIMDVCSKILDSGKGQNSGGCKWKKFREERAKIVDIPEKEFRLEPGKQQIARVMLINNTDWPLKQGCRVIS